MEEEPEMTPEVEGPTAGLPSKYKIVFLGDTYVGKTCIINRFMYDTFNENYQVTIGIDFLSKSMYVEDKIVKLQLWDTAGQEKFRSLIPNYLREAAAAVVTFDVTNADSFKSIKKWVEDARNLQGDKIRMMLVANKVDLSEKRVVSTEEGEKLAKEIGLQYIEASAKDGTNINELFKRIAASLPGLEGAEITNNNEVIGLHLTTPEPSVAAKKGCC